MVKKKYDPDEKDWQIIELLRAGVCHNNAIAAELGVSEGMIRQRIKRLKENDILSLRGLINPGILAQSQIVMIGAKVTEAKMLEETAEKVEKLNGVLSVSIVTGRYDLIIEVLLDSHKGLIDFVSKELAMVPGILHTESFIYLKTYSKFV